MAMKHHPDAVEGSEEKFKTISEAYQTLSDPAEKQIYDMKIGNRAEQNVYSDIAQKEREILEKELEERMKEPKHIKEERERNERELLMRRKENREKAKMMEFVNMFTVKEQKNPNKVEKEVRELNEIKRERLFKEHKRWLKFGKDWTKLNSAERKQVAEEKRTELEALRLEERTKEVVYGLNERQYYYEKEETNRWIFRFEKFSLWFSRVIPCLFFAGACYAWWLYIWEERYIQRVSEEFVRGKTLTEEEISKRSEKQIEASASEKKYVSMEEMIPELSEDMEEVKKEFMERVDKAVAEAEGIDWILTDPLEYQPFGIDFDFVQGKRTIEEDTRCDITCFDSAPFLYLLLKHADLYGKDALSGYQKINYHSKQRTIEEIYLREEKASTPGKTWRTLLAYLLLTGDASEESIKQQFKKSRGEIILSLPVLNPREL